MHPCIRQWQDLSKRQQAFVLHKKISSSLHFNSGSLGEHTNMDNTINIHDVVDRIVAQSGRTKESVIPILQLIQKEFRYLPAAALQRVCDTTDITPAGIESVASFYDQFRFKPAGRHIIRVCTGTACHVKGSGTVYDAFARELGLKEGQFTDSAGLFTLEKVACLGCCTLAPVVKIDEITYGHVTPEFTGSLLKDFLAKSLSPKGREYVRDLRRHKIQGEIRIGLGSCCVASGSEEVKRSLEETLTETGINISVKQVGMCWGLQPCAFAGDH